MIQKWIGLGRIGSDAELVVFPSGNQGLKFSLAIDDSYFYNGQWVDRTYWIPVDVNLPSLVQSYQGRLLKGTLVWVEGKLCTYTFQDSQGNQRSGFKIEASSLRIIPQRNTTQSSTQYTTPQQNIQQMQPQENTNRFQPPQQGQYTPPLQPEQQNVNTNNTQTIPQQNNVQQSQNIQSPTPPNPPDINMTGDFIV